jgi:hypothetical protein
MIITNQLALLQIHLPRLGSDKNGIEKILVSFYREDSKGET